MTHTTTHPVDAKTLAAAKNHARQSWREFIRLKGLRAALSDWHTGQAADGSPVLSVQVAGADAGRALRWFAADYQLLLALPGDMRARFDLSEAGRSVLVWRYLGVWVELWHPDLPDTPPRDVVPVPGVVGRRTLLRRPGGRLPFTRKSRTTNPDKETTR